jgi:hypothetical protein
VLQIQTGIKTSFHIPITSFLVFFFLTIYNIDINIAFVSGNWPIHSDLFKTPGLSPSLQEKVTVLNREGFG